MTRAALEQQEQEPAADERDAMKAEYGRTDAGFTIAGIQTTEGDKRLIALLMRALGSDHPAVDDLVKLLFICRVKDAQEQEEQQRAALLEALKGAANYIDVLGGTSESYRQVIAKAEGRA